MLKDFAALKVIIVQNLLTLLSHPLLGSVLGILGIFLGFYFYLAGKVVSRISLHHVELSVIGSATSVCDEHLEIKFQNEPVKRLTKNLTRLWNSGNKTINGADIVRMDRLRAFVSPDNKILQVWIIKKTRDIVEVNYEIKGNEVFIDFDFLDQSDGFAIEITHSGGLGELEWAGTIKGMPKGLKKDSPQIPVPGKILKIAFSNKKFFLSFVLSVLFSGGIGSLLIGIFGKEAILSFIENAGGSRLEFNNQWSLASRAAFSIVGLSYIFFGVAAVWQSRRGYPTSLELKKPKGDSSELTSLYLKGEPPPAS